MTDQLHDTRVIEPTAEKYNATLVKREDDNDSLARFWVRTDGPMPDFEPGQYMTIGVYADDKLYQRPYSVASSQTLHAGYHLTGTFDVCPRRQAHSRIRISNAGN